MFLKVIENVRGIVAWNNLVFLVANIEEILADHRTDYENIGDSKGNNNNNNKEI